MYECVMNFIRIILTFVRKVIESVYGFVMRHKNTIFWALMALMFCLMAFYFYIIPYSSVDDMTYMNNLVTKQPLSSFLDIIQSQKSHWATWSGRILAHGHLQLMFLLGKAFLSVQMSFVLLFIPIMISKIVDKQNKINPFIVLSSMALFYYLNPVWNDVMWVTGFQVYVTTTAWILLFIYLFIQNIKFNTKSNTLINNVITLSILGFMVGCSVEAMSVSLVAVVFLLLLRMKKEKLLQSKHISAFIFMLIGTAILILAPGNGVRASYIYTLDPKFSFHNICVRIFNFLVLMAKSGFGIFVLLMLVYHFANKEKMEKEPLFMEYVIIGILAILSMFAAPQGFATRVFIPIMCIFFIAIYICARNIEFSKHKKLLNQLVIYSYLGYMFMMLYGMIIQLFKVM